MQSITLVLIDPQHGHSKFYILSLPEASLELLHEWGPIGKTVTRQWTSHKSAAAAVKAFERARREKLKAGYIESAADVLPPACLVYQQKKAQTAEDGQLSLWQ
jgi:predicted DNA-binding WGR domain protein